MAKLLKRSDLALARHFNRSGIKTESGKRWRASDVAVARRRVKAQQRKEA